jgi:Kelch motif
MGRAAPILLPAALLIGCATASVAPSAISRDTPTPRDTEDAPPTSAAASVTPAPVAAAEWQALPDAPIARLEMATAAHDGRIWLAGGLSPTGEGLTDVEIYDPADDSWTDGPALPIPLHHASLASDGARLVLIGGYIGSSFSVPSADTWILPADADAWVAGPPLPEARGAGTAAWDGERVVYAGGVGSGGVADEIYVLEDDGWRAIGILPSPREHFAAASDGAGSIWFLGGRVASLESNMGDVALLVGDEVRTIGQLPTPRGGVAAFLAPGVGPCLTGGEAPTQAFAQVECMDDRGTVTSLNPMRTERHGHGAAVIDSVAYVLLGGPTPGLSAHSSLESLALAGD